jgi:DNA-directed RNA polymerase specialized sigma24 family protein
MKAETRKVRSHSTAKPKRQAKPSGKATATRNGKAKSKRKEPPRPIVNDLSDDDFNYLVEKLTKRWAKGRYRLLARDLAQEGALKAWLKQGEYKAKNGASLRTFSYSVALNEGRSIVRLLEHRESLVEKNQRRIAENFGETLDSDSGCYRVVGGNREPIRN